MKTFLVIAIFATLALDMYLFYACMFNSKDDSQFIINFLVWFSVLLIALIMFVMYLHELKHEEVEKKRTQVWEMYTYIQALEERN